MLVRCLFRVACTFVLHIEFHGTPLSLAPRHLYAFAFLRIATSFIATNHVLLTERGAKFSEYLSTLPAPDDFTSALVHTPRFAHLLRDECTLCFSRRLASPIQLFHALAWLVLGAPPRRRGARFTTAEWRHPRRTGGV